LMPGMRYHAPLATLFCLSVALSEDDPPTLGEASRTSRTVGLAATVSLIVIANLAVVAALRQDALRNERSTETAMVALGRWLGASLPAGTLLAVSDAGAMPYYSNLPTLDTNPHSLLDLTIAQHGWSSDYFFERNPGVVIFVSFSLVEPRFYSEHYRLLTDPRFTKQYRHIGTTRYDWDHDRCYWVYVRDSIKLSNEQLSRFPRGIGW